MISVHFVQTFSAQTSDLTQIRVCISDPEKSDTVSLNT